MTTQENLPMQIDFLISQVKEIQEILKTKSDERAEAPKKYLNLNDSIFYFKKLGFTMSKSRLYKMTSSMAIKHFKIGSRLFFIVDDLDVWLANETNKIENGSYQSNQTLIEAAMSKSRKN